MYGNIAALLRLCMYQLGSVPPCACPGLATPPVLSAWTCPRHTRSLCVGTASSELSGAGRGCLRVLANRGVSLARAGALAFVQQQHARRLAASVCRWATHHRPGVHSRCPHAQMLDNLEAFDASLHQQGGFITWTAGSSTDRALVSEAVVLNRPEWTAGTLHLKLSNTTLYCTRTSLEATPVLQDPESHVANEQELYYHLSSMTHGGTTSSAGHTTSKHVCFMTGVPPLCRPAPTLVGASRLAVSEAYSSESATCVCGTSCVQPTGGCRSRHQCTLFKR